MKEGSAHNTHREGKTKSRGAEMRDVGEQEQDKHRQFLALKGKVKEKHERENRNITTACNRKFSLKVICFMAAGNG